MKYNFERFKKEKKLSITVAHSVTKEEMLKIQKLAKKHNISLSKVINEITSQAIKEINKLK